MGGRHNRRKHKHQWLPAGSLPPCPLKQPIMELLRTLPGHKHVTWTLMPSGISGHFDMDGEMIDKDLENGLQVYWSGSPMISLVVRQVTGRS